MILQNPPNLIFLLQLFLSLSLQILLPCYCGTMLTSESARLRANVYGSNWMDQSKRFKTSFSLLQQRAVNLIVPTTYKKTFVIGLETFVAVSLHTYIRKFKQFYFFL